MKKILIEIIQWSWCLPQTLVGLIVKWIYKGKKEFYCTTDNKGYYEYTAYISYKMSGAISLGKYIILGRYSNNYNTYKHEYGHQKQSFILGWLYLIVIGLPSLIWCTCFGKYRTKHNISYYSFYTEKWANKLGGVEDEL